MTRCRSSLQCTAFDTTLPCCEAPSMNDDHDDDDDNDNERLEFLCGVSGYSLTSSDFSGSTV